MKQGHITILRLTSAVTAGFTFAIVPQAAQAAGVLAGTLIENTASATYSSGTASGSVSSNTVTVKVDELLDVAVAGLTTTPVTAGSTSVVLDRKQEQKLWDAFRQPIDEAFARKSTNRTFSANATAQRLPPARRRLAFPIPWDC